MAQDLGIRPTELGQFLGHHKIAEPEHITERDETLLRDAVRVGDGILDVVEFFSVAWINDAHHNFTPRRPKCEDIVARDQTFALGSAARHAPSGGARNVRSTCAARTTLLGQSQDRHVLPT
jgi:hypothetical protein